MKDRAPDDEKGSLHSANAALQPLNWEKLCLVQERTSNSGTHPVKAASRPFLQVGRRGAQAVRTGAGLASQPLDPLTGLSPSQRPRDPGSPTLSGHMGEN